MTTSPAHWFAEGSVKAERKQFELRGFLRELRVVVIHLPWEAIGWLLLATLLILGCPWACWRATYNSACDFNEFHAAGRAMLLNGVRDADGIFRYYLPSLNVAWAGLGWLPLR